MVFPPPASGHFAVVVGMQQKKLSKKMRANGISLFPAFLPTPAMPKPFIIIIDIRMCPDQRRTGHFTPNCANTLIATSIINAISI